MVRSFVSSINNEFVLRRKRLRRRPVRSACLSRCLKGKTPQPQKVSVHFAESEASWISQETQDESGYAMEDCESYLEAPANPDSLLESIIMVATPLPTRYQPPTLPHTPCRPRHVSPIVIGRSVGSPMYRVTRSRAARN